MHWLYLILAGCFECAFTTCLKLSDGLTKIGWSVAVRAAVDRQLRLLDARGAGKISLGTAYAVWTGIGAVGTAVIGIIWFKDPATFWRLLFFLTGLDRLPGRFEGGFA